MTQIWLEKLKDAPSKVERDEILLRSLKESRRSLNDRVRADASGDVEDQLRALADLAFPK